MKQTIVALSLLLLAACASSPKTDSPQTPPAAKISDGSQAATDTSSAGKSAPVSRMEIEAGKLAAETQMPEESSVYFDFDQYAIKPEYRDVVALQAGFIKAHKNDIVTLKGNADERGSNEYNLALGDRRANTVRKNLELLGVPAAQIRAVSLGEEKPRLACHEEKCWKENRRCDFVHSSQ